MGMNLKATATYHTSCFLAATLAAGFTGAPILLWTNRGLETEGYRTGS